MRKLSSDTAIFQLFVLYMFAMGIMNHSGVDIKQPWLPWQPDTMFHDNHHQYFHVNFGFNCTWWDKVSFLTKEISTITK